MDDVYDLLAKNKQENESFSDVLRRTLKRTSILSCSGALKNADTDKMKALIAKTKNKSTKKLLP